jgi:hypothetical protein
MQNRVFLGTQPNDSGIYERTEKNGIAYVRETPLIAAAPDLLAVAEGALQVLETLNPDQIFIITRLKQAIAKARGQA